MEIPDDIITTLLPAVEEQLTSSQTPYVKKAYESLISRHNLSSEESKELIAQALAIAVNQVYISGKPFNDQQYKQLLADLPLLPDESDSVADS